MLRPITSKAEISIDFPEKTYIGSFAEHSQFAVDADDRGMALKLVHFGEGRTIAELHLHYFLLADILAEAAKAIAARPILDDVHREPLREAVKELEHVLVSRRPGTRSV
jgi:hypothetical protein